MEKLGHLHYELRELSGQCQQNKPLHSPHTYSSCTDCPVAFLTGAGSHFIALCTCECHPINQSASEGAA